MRKLLAAAAFALISASAQAEVHEFRFGGSTWRVQISGKCRDLSCVRVSEEKAAARARKAAKPVKSAAPSPVAAAPKPAASKVATPAAAVPPVAAPAAAAAPSATAPVPSSAPATFAKAEPQIDPAPADDPRLPLLIVEDATPAPQPAVTEPRIEPTIPSASAEPGPLGVWLTEKGEGMVRIEPCGAALCGHTEGSRAKRSSSTCG
jgi:hypothetical protein